MAKVTLVPIKTLKGFDKAEFCVKPSYWGHEYRPSYDIPEKVMAEAKKLAEAVDEICFAKVEDDFGEYVIGDSCSKGCSSKLLLFNATEVGRDNAEIRAITFNTGRGALTAYWFDRWVGFKKGSTF